MTQRAWDKQNSARPFVLISVHIQALITSETDLARQQRAAHFPQVWRHLEASEQSKCNTATMWSGWELHAFCSSSIHMQWCPSDKLRYRWATSAYSNPIRPQTTSIKKAPQWHDKLKLNACPVTSVLLSLKSNSIFVVSTRHGSDSTAITPYISKPFGQTRHWHCSINAVEINEQPVDAKAAAFNETQITLREMIWTT